MGGVVVGEDSAVVGAGAGGDVVVVVGLVAVGGAAGARSGRGIEIVRRRRRRSRSTPARGGVVEDGSQDRGCQHWSRDLGSGNGTDQSKGR